MGKNELIKFRHGNHKGIFHYTTIDGDLLALSEVKSGKIEYIKEHGCLDITFNPGGETYDVMNVEIITDKDLVQRVFDKMLENNNNYFKDGFDELCVLKLHK